MRLMAFYVTLMSGMLMLFFMAGLMPGGFTGALMNIIMRPEQAIQWSQFTFVLDQIIAGIGVGVGVTLGILFKNIELAVKAPITALLATLLTDFTGVVTVATSEVGLRYLFYLLAAPFYILFIFVVVDYWAGRE